MNKIEYIICIFVELSYIASFEIDKFMYFFFRELAVEYVNGKIHYSRIGRVCKVRNDGSKKYSIFMMM